ncbi:MAG: DUF4249 domain-containing protein [Bacteroidales bacterium]|nr:DUF4249 domain-containing protein [Bacteroidales bacterium]
MDVLKRLNLKLAGIFVLGIVCFNACITEFKPDVSDYEYALVVDGRITNQKKNHTIKLSKSYNYGADKGKAVNGALVRIISDDGTNELLVEKGNGIYTTSANFSAIVGSSYRLYIKYEDKEYESIPEIMLPVNKVDSVFWQVEDREGMGSGVQLFVSSGKRGIGKESEYYKWEFNETWKFSVQVFENNAKPFWYCWKNVPSADYYVGSSEGLAGNVIEKQALNFISTETNRLFYRYSINVYQYSMNRNSYLYFKQLKEQLESSSSLFEKTPMVLHSNISCITDESEIVLGYFEVSEVDSSRIFIDKNELPSGINWSGLTNFDTACVMYNTIVDTSMAYQQLDQSLIIDTLVTPTWDTFLVHYYSRRCFDCTATGFPNVPPDYWKE